MTRLAAGSYLAGSSWIHQRHPLTKLFALLFIVVAAFLLPAVALLPLGVAVLAIAASAGMAVPLARSLRVPAVLLFSIVAVNAVLFPGGRDVLVSIGPLAVTREGLTFGLVSATRLLVVFLAAMTVLYTTLPDDLLEGLVARGVSHRIAFVVLSAVQLVPRLRDRAGRILAAQSARGLAVHGSFGTRVRALVPVIGPVILGAVVGVRERTLALEARGFGARPGRTAYRIVPDPPVDRWLRAGVLAATALVVAASLIGLVR